MEPNTHVQMEGWMYRQLQSYMSPNFLSEAIIKDTGTHIKQTLLFSFFMIILYKYAEK